MPRSMIVATCISVCPTPLGTTVQPSASAPDSSIEPAGVKPRPARSFPLRVRDLAGKRGHQQTFSLLRVAGFKAVVVLRHRIGGVAQKRAKAGFGAGNIAHKIRMGYKKLIFGLFPFSRRAGNFLPSRGSS